MSRVSSSVRVARTRIWRTTGAIRRGGNLRGAAWHRPQLARNRSSPSRRVSWTVLLSAPGFAAGGVSLRAPDFGAADTTAPMVRARNRVTIANLVFIAHLHRETLASQTGK